MYITVHSIFYCTVRHVRKVKEWFPLFCICARTVRFFVQKSQADRWAVELMKSEKFCLHLRAAAGWPGPLSSLQLSFSFIFVHFWVFLTRKSKKVTEWNAKNKIIDSLNLWTWRPLETNIDKDNFQKGLHYWFSESESHQLEFLRDWLQRTDRIQFLKRIRAFTVITGNNFRKDSWMMITATTTLWSEFHEWNQLLIWKISHLVEAVWHYFLEL